MHEFNVLFNGPKESKFCNPLGVKPVFTSSSSNSNHQRLGH